jgi:hypothetical protein
MADFRVKYVLGVAPLQQYMVEFDRLADQPANELARVASAADIVDTAGQRWFHLDPPDVRESSHPTMICIGRAFCSGGTTCA